MARSFAVKAVHKGMYPATYNFRDDADGAVPTFITTDDSGGTCTVTIIPSLDGHRKVLKLYDPDAANRCICYHAFASGQVTGTIEFFMHTTDATFENSVIARGEDTGYRIQFSLYQDKFQYYDGGWNDVGLVGLDNTTYHVKFIFSCTTDTYEIWIDGVQYQAAAAFTGVATTLDDIRLNTSTASSGYSLYFDAFGFSWDADYAIGDNVHWRHYKESTDDFEGDDVGTQGTSITWVDGVDTAASFEIVPEFGEHKKVLRGYYSSGAGGYDYSSHNFATQAKTGWWEGWIKATDATTISLLQFKEDATIIIQFQISGDKFQVHTGGAFRDVTNAPIPIDATWYHVYIQWYDAATDTFDLWIDNVQYEDGTNCSANQTSGINKIFVVCYSPTLYMYIDAPMSSLDGDSRGDNRLLDYNASYTKEDITDDVINVVQTNKLHEWRKASLFALTQYTKATVFFQIYDITTKLGGEFEIQIDFFNGATYTHLLIDKNAAALKNDSSNTFAAAAIHDPTASGSMLKTVLPTVGQASGRLLLVNADAKATTYSPVTKSYPDGLFLRDLSNLANSVTIIEPSGKIDLDDDKASGDALDVDTDQDYFISRPLISNIQENINFFDVYGTIDPATGTRFHKNIDNTGNDEKRPWSITDNNLRSQADVDAFATAVSTRIVDIKQINLKTLGLQCHSMGETFTLTYVDDVYTITATAFYIISEEYNYDKAQASMTLSEGLIEKSDYARAYERSFEETNVAMSEIYETDKVYGQWYMKPYNGATEANGLITVNAVLEGVVCYFSILSAIDPTRPMKVSWWLERTDAGGAAPVISLTLWSWDSGDAVASPNVEWNAVGDSFTASAINVYIKKEASIPATNLTADRIYELRFVLTQAATSFVMYCVDYEYYIKRSLS